MRNLLRHCLLPLLIALFATACAPSDEAPTHTALDRTLITADGFRIAATLYPAAADQPPGLILIHEAGGTRQDWEPLARRAQRHGYAVIAIDVRGHGESSRQAGERFDYRDFGRSDWMQCLEDIDAARQALLEAGAHPDDLAAVGAGIGANLLVHYALRQADIQAIVLVSPGLEYRGIETEEAFEALGPRPVMFLHAAGDSYSASSALRLKQLARGYVELREYAGTAHGAGLFVQSEHALEQVFVWLEPIVGPGRRDRP